MMPPRQPVIETRFVIESQFEDVEQQHSAATFGMWVFLATEVLFFGGMFLGYAAYRYTYPVAFGQLSRELNVVIGGINTAVLLTSSLTMALAVREAQLARSRRLAAFLHATALLGILFLGFKALEYATDYRQGLVPGPLFRLAHANAADQPRQLLLLLYYAMTGLHAVHLTIGVALVLRIARSARRGDLASGYPAAVEVTGLYWHFIDIVWIFLFPLLYLLDRRSGG